MMGDFYRVGAKHQPEVEGVAPFACPHCGGEISADDLPVCVTIDRTELRAVVASAKQRAHRQTEQIFEDLEARLG